MTRKWLAEAADDMRSHDPQPPTEGATTSSPSSSSLTPVGILNHAYMKLLDWEDTELFPEVRELFENSILSGQGHYR